MITTIAYFQTKGHPNYIPNLITGSDVSEIEIAAVNFSISVYEPEYLKNVLGVKLYDQYVVDIEDDVLKVKWESFIEKLTDTTTFMSPIADYIYINHICNNCLIFNGLGANLGVPNEKGEITPVIVLQQRAIYNMIAKNKVFLAWIYDNSEEFDTDNLIDFTCWESMITYNII